MRITSVGPARAASAKRRKSAASSTEQTFSPAAASKSAAAPAASGSAPSVPINAVLALQGVSNSGGRGSSDMARGSKILEHLDKIRLGLLAGGIPRQTLRRLTAELSATRAETADPRLRAILDEIELRARVEIAKYDNGV
ncbi:MAG: flagellar biosynthesis protein FlgI [Rhodospirillaceae bacterium]|nr:flagellar biosynthesis protein FlgI [Rhodospirillaceae bacterium]